MWLSLDPAECAAEAWERRGCCVGGVVTVLGCAGEHPGRSTAGGPPLHGTLEPGGGGGTIGAVAAPHDGLDARAGGERTAPARALA